MQVSFADVMVHTPTMPRFRIEKWFLDRTSCTACSASPTVLLGQNCGDTRRSRRSSGRSGGRYSLR
jgi:hypothetical protein